MTVPARVSTWDAQRIHELDRGSRVVAGVVDVRDSPHLRLLAGTGGRVEAWTLHSYRASEALVALSPQRWVDVTGPTRWECRAALVFS